MYQFCCVTPIFLPIPLLVVSGLYPGCKWRACSVHSRDRTARHINEDLFPTTERGRRMSLGLPNLNELTSMNGRDPRLAESYAEFPLSSLDALLDHAERITNQRPRRIVDVGSGCGRLVFYLALSRSGCDVSGIEISETFHNEGCHAAEKAIGKGLINYCKSNDQTSSISLHLGPASDFPKTISEADLIFCYSTTFSGSVFCQTSLAVLLAPEWSQLFSQHCKHGCICITTDKALDPSLGWRHLGRLEVPNPEVVSSTGFIQIHMGNPLN
jgi:SAM-dependent methyltransferase